jgi:hypothetical protein
VGTVAGRLLQGSPIGSTPVPLAPELKPAVLSLLQDGTVLSAMSVPPADAATAVLETSIDESALVTAGDSPMLGPLERRVYLASLDPLFRGRGPSPDAVHLDKVLAGTPLALQAVLDLLDAQPVGIGLGPLGPTFEVELERARAIRQAALVRLDAGLDYQSAEAGVATTRYLDVLLGDIAEAQDANCGGTDSQGNPRGVRPSIAGDLLVKLFRLLQQDVQAIDRTQVVDNQTAGTDARVEAEYQLESAQLQVQAEEVLLEKAQLLARSADDRRAAASEEELAAAALLERAQVETEGAKFEQQASDKGVEYQQVVIERAKAEVLAQTAALARMQALERVGTAELAGFDLLHQTSASSLACTESDARMARKQLTGALKAAGDMLFHFFGATDGELIYYFRLSSHAATISDEVTEGEAGRCWRGGEADSDAGEVCASSKSMLVARVAVSAVHNSRPRGVTR